MNKLSKYVYKGLSKRFFFHPGIITETNHFDSVFIQKIDKNFDTKVFYIIYRKNGGSGFFSNLLHVYRHIQIADKFNFIPIVDFLNYPTIYSLDNIYKTDSWNNYFEPVSEYSLAEVYKQSNLLLCDGNFPVNASMNYDFKNQDSLDYFKSKIKIRKELLEEINMQNDKLCINKHATLGVHWRGGEQNQARGHWFGATKPQMFKEIDYLLATNNYEQIFISTERLDYLKSMIKRYGHLIKYTNYFRTNMNSYKTPVRNEHYFLLGKEILIDAMILANCKGLIHADSNVSDFAIFINNNHYSDRIKIDNGMNKNDLLSLFRFGIIKGLPSNLGGLKNKISKYKNDLS